MYGNIIIPNTLKVKKNRMTHFDKSRLLLNKSKTASPLIKMACSFYWFGWLITSLLITICRKTYRHSLPFFYKIYIIINLYTVLLLKYLFKLFVHLSTSLLCLSFYSWFVVSVWITFDICVKKTPPLGDALFIFSDLRHPTSDFWPLTSKC